MSYLLWPGPVAAYDDNTGQHIADEVGTIVSQWCSPTISCCVTDNATNIISGIKKHNETTCHVLHIH